MRFFHVDAFTDRPFAGNPAGVVLPDSPPSASFMQALAREMNLSETVFVLPPRSSGASFALRWFTPAAEVPLCGHATVAALEVLCSLGKMPEGPVSVETASGIIAVMSEARTEGFLHRMEQPEGDVVVVERGFDHAMDLGVPPEALDTRYPVAESRSGNTVLVIPIVGSAELRDLGHAAIRWNLLDPGQDGIQFFAFTDESLRRVEARSFIHPRLGVAEDPACGTCAAALGRWMLARPTTTPSDGPFAVEVSTGAALLRPGLIRVDVAPSGRLRIGGRARILFAATLPDERPSPAP